MDGMTTADVRAFLREWADTIPNGPHVGDLRGMALTMGERELRAFLAALERFKSSPVAF